MKLKRILAMLCVIFILALYLIALVAAFSHSPNASSWLMAAIFSTVIIPVFLYAAQLVYKLLRDRKDTEY